MAPGAVYRGDTGGIACGSYHEMEQDFELRASLRLGASINEPQCVAKLGCRTDDHAPDRADLCFGG